MFPKDGLSLLKLTTSLGKRLRKFVMTITIFNCKWLSKIIHSMTRFMPYMCSSKIELNSCTTWLRVSPIDWTSSSVSITQHLVPKHWSIERRPQVWERRTGRVSIYRLGVAFSIGYETDNPWTGSRQLVRSLLTYRPTDGGNTKYSGTEDTRQCDGPLVLSKGTR